MSFVSWGITGYGLVLDDISLFDGKKLAHELGVDLEFEDGELTEQEISNLKNEDYFEMLSYVHDMNLEEILEALAEKSDLLEHGNTVDADTGQVLYYPSKMSWNVPTKHYNLTEQDIKDEIIHILKPVLLDGVDIEELRKSIDYVNMAGMSN